MEQQPPKSKLHLLAATVLFLAAGVIAFIIGLIGPFDQEDRSGPVSKATLKPERGGTTLKRSGGSLNVTKDILVFVGDTITTDDIGRAWVDFGPHHGTLALQEESEIELVSLNLGIMVRLRKGALEVLSAPEKSRVVVQYPDSKIKKLADIETSYREQRPLLEPDPKGSQAITQELLEQAISRLRPNILKCYSQFLGSQANRDKIDITATVTYLGGRVGARDVVLNSKTNLDQRLANCIEDALKKLNLAPYKGPLIDIQLPIILE